MEHDEGVIWNNAITRSKAHPVQNNKKVRKDLSSYRSFQRFLKKKCERNSMDSWWWFRVSKSDVFYIWMRSRYQSDRTQLFTMSKRRSARRRLQLRFPRLEYVFLQRNLGTEVDSQTSFSFVKEKKLEIIDWHLEAWCFYGELSISLWIKDMFLWRHVKIIERSFKEADIIDNNPQNFFWHASQLPNFRCFEFKS